MIGIICSVFGFIAITVYIMYKVKQIYLSGYPCKLQLKYFNVVKSAILISVFDIADRFQNKTITNTNIDKQIDR